MSTSTPPTRALGIKRKYARENRKSATPAEQALWQQLRGSKLGPKFRRQHAIDFFIVDFICVAARLIIEVDGEIHLVPEHAEYDAGRTFTLTELGYRELRFTNQQVLHHLDEVLATTQENLKAENPEHSSGSPSFLERGPGVRLPRTTCPN